jgi:hypothetical protein
VAHTEEALVHIPGTNQDMAGVMSRKTLINSGLLIGSIRVSIGLVLLVVPSLARIWVGEPAARAGGRALSRSLSAREIALGGGVLLARSDPRRLRSWLALGAFGDLVDAVTTIGTRGLPARSRLWIALSSSAAAVAGGAASLACDSLVKEQDVAGSA